MGGGAILLPGVELDGLLCAVLLAVAVGLCRSGGTTQRVVRAIDALLASIVAAVTAEILFGPLASVLAVWVVGAFAYSL